MRYLPKLQQLRVFQEVVQQGSIRSAARTLSQSQPAVSRTLKALENVLETSLFYRGSRGITLTPSGELFALRARRILAELQRAGEEIRFQQQQEGQIVIGMSALPGLLLLPSALRPFQRQYPALALTVTTGSLRTLLPALTSGEMDFACCTLPVGFVDQRLHIRPLFSAPLCVAGSPHHADLNAESLCQHPAEKWLQVTESGETNSELEAELAARYPLPPTLLRTDSLPFACQLAQTSGYLLVMPRPLLTTFSHELQTVNLPLRSVQRYSVVWPRHTPLTVSAQRLLTQLMNSCRHSASSLTLFPEAFAENFSKYDA